MESAPAGADRRALEVPPYRFWVDEDIHGQIFATCAVVRPFQPGTAVEEAQRPSLTLTAACDDRVLYSFGHGFAPWLGMKGSAIFANPVTGFIGR